MSDHATELAEILRAVYRKDTAALRLLTREQVNLTDADGRTPLMHAVLADDAEPGVVQLLIDRGAAVDVADTGQRWTALHFAARDQRADLVRVLLDAAAPIDPVDSFGNTPLWRSVMTARADLGAIRALVERGADPHRANASGHSPMDIARRSGHPEIVAALEQRATT